MKFLTFKFWFSLYPGPLVPLSFYFFISIFSIFILIAIIIKFKTKTNEKFIEKIYNETFTCFLTIGILGNILVFFNYQKVLFLSSRFWYILLFLTFIFWIIYIIKLILKIKPLQQKKIKKQEFEKYLPKSK